MVQESFHRSHPDPLKVHVVVYSVTLNTSAGKCLFTLNTTIRWPLSSLKKKTDLQISNYGASAQAGLVTCLCFCGLQARTEIAMLGP